MKKDALLAAAAYLQRTCLASCKLHRTPSRPLLHTHCKIFLSTESAPHFCVTTANPAAIETALLSFRPGRVDYTKSTHHAGERRLVLRSTPRPSNPPQNLPNASFAKTDRAISRCIFVMVPNSRPSPRLWKHEAVFHEPRSTTGRKRLAMCRQSCLRSKQHGQRICLPSLLSLGRTTPPGGLDVAVEVLVQAGGGLDAMVRRLTIFNIHLLHTNTTTSVRRHPP